MLTLCPVSCGLCAVAAAGDDYDCVPCNEHGEPLHPHARRKLLFGAPQGRDEECC